MFPNPVAGRILPRGAARTGDQFVVTQTAAEHASRPPPAIDIGNGRAGSPVWAMASGRVIEVRPTLDGVLTIETPDHWRMVYAHMTGVVASLGQLVTAGEGIGFVGAVSPTPIYAHLHLQLAHRRLLVWTWLDPWQYLEQNVAITVNKYPTPRTWTTKGGLLTGYQLAGAPVTKGGLFGVGSPALASAEVIINPLPLGWPPNPYLAVLNGYFTGWWVPMAAVNPGDPPALDCAPAVAAERSRWVGWLGTRPD